MTGFYRFPHTPHAVWMGRGERRDDKVLSGAELAELLHADVVLEEKIDGANLGFSLGDGGELQTQNRGRYLAEPHSGQFARLPSWLAMHGDAVLGALLEYADEGLMLFGEWCAARHSLAYTRLPDWFLLFDVVDRRQGRFWSSARRNALAAQLGLATTPTVARGRFSMLQLKAQLAEHSSRFRDGAPEGIVIRRENAQWCEQRAKLVRADFTQTITEHWRHRHIEWNRLDRTSST